MSKKSFSAREVAAILGVHKNTIIRLAQLGRIEVERVGNMYVFEIGAVEAARSLVTGNRQTRHEYPALEAANTDDYLSVQEVGAALGLGDRQVWRLITDAALRAWRFKGMVLLEKTAVEALRQQRAANGPRVRSTGGIRKSEELQ